MEAGFHQLRRGGTLVLVGAGIEAPDLRPQPLRSSTSSTSCGSFVYDADGFERALDAAGLGTASRIDLLIEAEDVALDGISEALVGLAEGRHRRQGHGGARTRADGARPRQEGMMTHPYYPTGNPRFNHVAMSVPADLLGRGAPGRDLPVLGRGARLRRDADDDPRPQAPDPVVACTGTSSSSSSPRTSPCAAPAWTTSGSPWARCDELRGRRATGPRRSASTTTGSTSSTSTSTTRGRSRSTRST